MLSSKSKESKFVQFDDLHKYFIYKNIFDFRVDETREIFQVREYTGLGKFRGQIIYTFVDCTVSKTYETQDTKASCCGSFSRFVHAYLSGYEE